MSDIDSEEKEITIPLRPSVVGGYLLAIASGLTVLHVVAMLSWYLDLFPIDDWLYISFFDLDEEESIGTWFSALLLFLASALSALQAMKTSRSGQGGTVGWYLLAIGFCLLSLDEVAGFHEFVNTMSVDTHWTTYGLVLVAATGLAFIPFLRSLPPRTRLLFIVSGAIYIGGAVIIERATIWYEVNDELDTLPYNLSTALEEFMEMAGVTLYVYALLSHMAHRLGGRPAAVSFH